MFSSCSKDKSEYDLIISSINIVDIKNSKIIENQYIGIKGERISIVSNSEIKGSKSTLIIDGKGKYLIPGLWDMHCHYWWNYGISNRLLIANGVVGIREMFGNVQEISKIRDYVNRGLIYAPGNCFFWSYR